MYDLTIHSFFHGITLGLIIGLVLGMFLTAALFIYLDSRYRTDHYLTGKPKKQSGRSAHELTQSDSETSSP
jgi:hypothetical protein